MGKSAATSQNRVNAMFNEIDLTYYTRKGQLRSMFKTFEWITDYAKANHGPTPTVSEIAVGRHLSRVTVYRHLDELEQLGLIVMGNGKIIVPDSIWIPPLIAF